MINIQLHGHKASFPKLMTNPDTQMIVLMQDEERGIVLYRGIEKVRDVGVWYYDFDIKYLVNYTGKITLNNK